MPTIVNLLPCLIRICRPDGTFLEIPPSGTLPRSWSRREVAHYIGVDPEKWIPVKHVSPVTFDLPEQVYGTILVVSEDVADANSERDDLVFPLNILRADDQSITFISLGTVHGAFRPTDCQ